MSNIDERVVKMEFDNKAFEKNASETMSTLDKLKELLKFDNVNKSFGKLTDAANKVDVSNVSEGIETVNAKLSTMQIVGATAISRVTNSLMNFGKKVVGGTFGQVIQGGINRAFNIEQAKFTIEGLGKDFTQLQEDINYAVSGTAYGFDEAAKAASMMAASGIEAGDEMKASLRGISGMAAMTGDSYSNIADIFGNIAGKGKLSLQEVNRFATRGINVSAKLAEMMGVTEEAVRDMISHGEVSFREFAAAMDEAFGEHATAANKTFNGVMANIKASLSRIGEAFVHPLMATNEKDTAFIATYKTFNEDLKGMADNAKKTTEGFVNARAAITSLVKKNDAYALHNSKMVGDLIKGNEKAYVDAMQNVYDLGSYSEAELHDMYVKDQKYVRKILKEDPEYARKSSAELAAIFSTNKENFRAAIREIPEYANKTDAQIDKMYTKYSGYQYNLVSVLQAFKRFMGTVESAVKGSVFLEKFIGLAERASKVLSLFFNAAAASLSDLTVAGKHIGQAIEIIGPHGNSYILKADKLWRKFGEAVGLADADIKNLRDTFKGLQSLFYLISDGVGAVINALSPLISGLLKNAIKIVLAFTGTLGRMITNFYKVADSTKLIQTIATVVSNVFKGLIFILTTVTDIIVSIFTAITSNPILDTIVDKLILIGHGISAIFTILADTGSRIIDVFLIPFETMGVAAEVTGGMIDRALQAVADGLDFFNDAIQATLLWVIKFIDEFVDFNEVLKIGREVAALFKNGFGLNSLFGMFSANETVFGSTIGGMAKDVDKSGGGLLDSFKKIFEGVSTKDFGKTIGKSIASGMSIAARITLNSIKFLADTLFGIIDKIDFNKVADFILEGFTTVADILVTGVSIVANAMFAFGTAFSKIDYSKIAANLGMSLGKIIEALSTVIGTIPIFISKVIDTMVSNMPNLQADASKIGTAIGDILAQGMRLVFKALPLIISVLWNALKTLLTKMPGIFGEFGKELSNVFGTSLSGAFSKVAEFIKNLSLFDALKAISWGELIVFIRIMIDVALGLKKTVGIFASMSNMFNGAGEALKSTAKVLQAHYIRSIVISVALMVGLAYILGKLDFAQLVVGLFYMIVCGGLLLAFVHLLSLIQPGITSIKGMNKLIAELRKLLLSISISLAIISILNPVKLLGAVGALGLVLLGLVFAVNMLKGCETAMASAAALAPLLLAIAGALAILSLFNFTTVMGSVLAIAAVLGVLVGFGAVSSLPAVAAGLTVLSSAISAFGIAVLAVGAGVYIFVSALQTLAMMGQDGSIANLGTAIQQLASYIPILFEGIGQGLLILAQTLADGATILADAFMAILETILERLLNAAQMFATVGVAILLILLRGIRDAIGEITGTVLDIITAFTGEVSGHMGEIIDSGMQLMINFVNGMADGLNAHSEELWAAVSHLVGEIINFVLDGLKILAEKIPFIGDDISKFIEGVEGDVSKFFGDGKIKKETEKGTKEISNSVDKETKSAGDKAKKNVDKIPKSMDAAGRKSKKSFKGVSDSVGKEFEKIPEMADIADEMSPKGESAIEAWTEEFKAGAKKKTGEDAIGKVKDGAESVDFGTVGANVFGGFAKSFNYSDWYNQGVKRASALNTGFKDTEDIGSPSKLWAKYGSFLYQGLANGLRKTTSKFYTAGANAAKGVNSGFSSVADLLSSFDFGDLSEPTIRPVLDLSNVKMGLNSLDRMMPNGTYALGLAGAMPTSGVSTARNITFNNRVTVDGSADPAQWADEFMQELEIQARTL